MRLNLFRKIPRYGSDFSSYSQTSSPLTGMKQPSIQRMSPHLPPLETALWL
jgi:hypothetical protein